MDSIRLNKLKDIEFGCCEAAGITCDKSGRVIKIEWRGYGLNGIINGDLLPLSLIELDLSDNDLRNIPILPLRLECLNLSNNSITGQMVDIPPKLVSLYVDHNYLTGDLPKLPKSLKIVHLESNNFTGKCAVNQPTQLFINDNSFSSVDIEDVSLLSPTNCDISNNSFLDIAIFKSLEVCIQDGLSLQNQMERLFKRNQNSMSNIQTVNTKVQLLFDPRTITVPIPKSFFDLGLKWIVKLSVLAVFVIIIVFCFLFKPNRIQKEPTKIEKTPVEQTSPVQNPISKTVVLSEPVLSEPIVVSEIENKITVEIESAKPVGIDKLLPETKMEKIMNLRSSFAVKPAKPSYFSRNMAPK